MTALTTWPDHAETWLDERGKFAWIGAIILGFIVFWPLGVALLIYTVFMKRKGSRTGSGPSFGLARAYRSSGNSAFDAYKAETLRRLEDEQKEFSAFLKRLRDARDKAEFDQFMDERTRDGREPVSQA